MLPLVAAVAALTLVVAALAGGLGQGYIARARATAAADAAALAAAPVTFRPFGSSGSPAEEAARFARLHGARLVSCRCPVDHGYAPREVTVVVEVRVDVVGLGERVFRATSRAAFEPLTLLGL